MLGMWVAAVAAILGVLVAAATGASAPAWWLLVLLVALPGAITLGSRRRRRQLRSDRITLPVWDESAALERDAGRNERSAPQYDAEGDAVPRAIAEDDWDVACEICCALGPRQLDWLRSDEFATPWLDIHVRPVVALESLLARAVDRPFEIALRTAVGELADALGAFIEYYRHNTKTDPLLLGGDWRFFQWDDRVQGDENGSDGAEVAAQAARLQQLAAEFALAYDLFSATASRNSHVRRRIAART